MESQLFVILLNFIYALCGGLMCIPICILAYYIFDKATPQFVVGQELKDGNTAVAITIGALLLGICICSGLVIGLGLN